jgi:hypothetical protein
VRKVTIMQFSDMHFSSVFPSIRAFVSSILTDIARQKEEIPPISKPNMLIICGDIIQGVDKNLPIEEASKQLRKQYQKAEDTLNLLCKKLFDGDKNRIVIVPGNHDVSWSHSQKSMEKIEKCGNLSNLNKLVKIAESNYRWDWDDLSYYRISDFDIYNRRFELFSEFYSTFYEGARKYSLDQEEQYDIFEYSDENVVVVGFNSCFRNDHLNSVGTINSECIAKCYEKISQKEFDDWVKIAVWHHDIQGYPSKSDFMDSRTLQFLIDKGFHLGFHGHNHGSDVFEVRFSVDETMKMNVFSCGSLGAPRDTIPLGESRQYGILELNMMDMTVRFNLRKALDQPPELPIWMAGSINQNRDKSYIDGELSIKIGKKTKMTDVMKKLAEIEGLISEKEYARALEKLMVMDRSNPFVRRLTIECYWLLDRNQDLIATIGKPTSLIEFTYLTDALWKEKDLDTLKKIVKESEKDQKIASSEVFLRIKKKIEDAENE